MGDLDTEVQADLDGDSCCGSGGDLGKRCRITIENIEYIEYIDWLENERSQLQITQISVRYIYVRYRRSAVQEKRGEIKRHA